MQEPQSRAASARARTAIPTTATSPTTATNINSTTKDSSTKTDAPPPPSALAVALIREFLAARDLPKSLDAFKSEIKEESAITSRVALASHLGITKAVAANRNSETPFETYLEILINQVTTHTVKRPSTSSSNSKSKYKTSSSSVAAPATGIESQSIAQQHHCAPTASAQVNSAKTTPDRREKDTSTANPPTKSALQPTPNNTQSASSDRSSLAIHMMRESFAAPATSPAFVSRASLVPSSAAATGGNNRYLSTVPRSFNNADPIGIEIIDDLEISDDEVAGTSIHHGPNALGANPAFQWSTSRGIRISPHLASEIRRILFSPEQVRGRAWFGEEWRGKGFVFNEAIDLGYGIVQLKGGPCGLLAAVQAHVIKYLIHTTGLACIAAGRLRPTLPQARTALIHTLSEMAWRAGGPLNRAIIVMNPAPWGMRGRRGYNRTLPTGTQNDTITDNFEYHTFNNLPATTDFVEAHIDQFMSNTGTTHGIIQILLSIILSRGIDVVRKDMDEPENKLMGRHGYCTQDMVNLALYGEAISNLHDGDIHLGSGIILKGIKQTVTIGQLSLFEHYNSMRVGDLTKAPTMPIYVVCSESHYTVLFSVTGTSVVAGAANASVSSGASSTPSPGVSLTACRDIPPGVRFDVFYYDGLANQSHEIRLTLSSSSSSTGNGGTTASTSTSNANASASAHRRGKSELVPPLDHCIHTKWPNAIIDWNDTEPLL